MRKMGLDFVRKIFGTNCFQREINKHYSEIRKNQLIEHILHDSELGVTKEKYINHEIVVSLTTHGKRIYDVALAIESIMQQSMKANRIILWLSDSLQNSSLPEPLVLQQKRGLEIAFCKDLGPYTKLIPALRRFPDEAIITIDDDALYDSDLLERLINGYLSNPSCIYCCRARRIFFTKDGSLLPYEKWRRPLEETSPSHLIFATGVGGVLYPPHSLDEEVNNEDAFLNICTTADDVWFNAMAIKNGTKVKKVRTRKPNGDDYLLNYAVQDIGLLHDNIHGKKLNDQQIHAVFSKYNIYPILQKESE